ncbi:MAG: hypothetical protein K5662_09110 [Lachnospiraceae bacterium]|nr:hypothetical protein [Lachnospiraceae bacterium]
MKKIMKLFITGIAICALFIQAPCLCMDAASVGRDNTYGHPTQADLNRLNAVKAEALVEHGYKPCGNCKPYVEASLQVTATGTATSASGSAGCEYVRAEYDGVYLDL